MPPTAGLGSLHLLAPRRLHAAFAFQPFDTRAIDLRPKAPGPSRREPHQEMIGVVPVGLPVDPAMTESNVERLVLVERDDTRLFLGKFDPQASGFGMGCQPGVQALRIGK